VLRNGDLQREALRWARDLLERAREGGWRSAVPMGVESPGLMTGIAGMGLELLRLSDPERVPSVLALDPPPRRGR
jgi:lantibiotic modifying enzyme